MQRMQNLFTELANKLINQSGPENQNDRQDQRDDGFRDNKNNME